MTRTPELDTVNAIRDTNSGVEAIRILRKHTEEAVKAEREKTIALLKNIPDGEDIKVFGLRMNEAGVCGWNRLRYGLIQNFDSFTRKTPKS